MHKEYQAIDYVKTLNMVNFEIAELHRIKEQMEMKLADLLDHHHDGSKSYVCDKYKVTITAGFNYSLNKDEYLVIGGRLPKCFNPVRQKIAYEIDKEIIREAERYASAEELQLLSSIITKKPRKLHIRVGAAS
jgi:hypothetical protein